MSEQGAYQAQFAKQHKAEQQTGDLSENVVVPGQQGYQRQNDHGQQSHSGHRANSNIFFMISDLLSAFCFVAFSIRKDLLFVKYAKTKLHIVFTYTDAASCRAAMYSSVMGEGVISLRRI